MNRFAQLLDRLAYEHGRNAKLRLMTEYFRTTPDPERGFTLAALTGALSFPHAKPGIIRALIAERTDPVLFELSHDYVGDLSETVALLWPRPSAAGASSDPPMLSDVVAKLAALGKTELPGQLARWLDALDETGRWALLKLVTGGLRIGVSARLAKTAVAALGAQAAVHRAVRLGRRFWRKAGRARSGAVSPGHARARARGGGSSPARSQGLCRRMEMGRHPRPGGERTRRGRSTRGAALFAHRRGYFQELSRPDRSTEVRGCDRRGIVDRARRPRPIVQHAAAAAQPQNRDAETHDGIPGAFARLRSAGRGRRGFARAAVPRAARAARSAGRTARRSPHRSLAAGRIFHLAGACRRAEKSGGVRGRRRRRGGRGRDAQAMRGRLCAGAAERPVVEMEARPGPRRRRADVRPARPRQALLVLFRLHVRGLAERARGRRARAGRQGVFRLHRPGTARDRSLRAAQHHRPLRAGARSGARARQGPGVGNRVRGPAAFDPAQVRACHALSPHPSPALGQAARRGRSPRNAGKNA